jgi:hypothetical protein
MPTIPTSPPPTEPGPSSPQAGELQLALFVSRYSLLGLSCIGGAVLIQQAWGPLWRNVLHFVLAAVVVLIIRLLWRQLARLMVVLSSLVVLIFLLLLLNPAQRCMLTAEDLTKLAANCLSGVGDAVNPLAAEQQAQRRILIDLQSTAAATKKDVGDLQSTAAATKKDVGDLQSTAATIKLDVGAVRVTADETKQGVAGLQRDLPKNAKSTELTPIAKDAADTAKRLELVEKVQYFHGKTLTEINGVCRQR